MNNLLIKWNKSYSVGISSIDEQHQKLIDIINKLFNSFSEGKADQLMPAVLDELADYTVYHFKAEEELFKESDYPEKENHISKHSDFIEQVKSWKIKLKSNDKNIHYECISFLKTWITEHIKEDDVAYSRYFK